VLDSIFMLKGKNHDPSLGHECYEFIVEGLPLVNGVKTFRLGSGKMQNFCRDNIEAGLFDPVDNPTGGFGGEGVWFDYCKSALLFHLFQFLSFRPTFSTVSLRRTGRENTFMLQ
jgi:hypothetical protein